MRKVWITLASALVLGGLAYGGATAYRAAFASKPQPIVAVKPAIPSQTPVADSTKHDTFDIEFARKLILYHELAAQMDDYAVTNATQPEVRQLATQKSVSNTEQMKSYQSLLELWDESYSTLDDYMLVAGGACSAYPMFPGMLPHEEVNTYLLSTGADVDRYYLSLMTKHHKGIELIAESEGKHIINGDMVKLRDNVYRTQKEDMGRMGGLRQQFGYV